MIRGCQNLLRWSVLSGMCLILACAAIAAHAAPNEGKSVPHQKTAEQEAARAAVKLFDTGAPSPTPLAGEAIARQTGWIAVPEDKTDHRFSGAAVVANDRLAIVLRRGAAGAELYSQAAGRAVLRAVLKPVADGPVGKLMSLAIVENSPAGVVIDVTYESPQGKKCGLRYELAMGQPYVQTEPREGATALSVEAPCRFVVLPDFFADDMVIDAAEIPVDTAELPSENFLLQMLPSHDAILMTVASNRGQDSRIELSGPAGPSGQRRIERSETFYGPRKVWVAVPRPPTSGTRRGEQGPGRQGCALGLVGSAARSVARGLAFAQRFEQQLGNGDAKIQRRIHQARLVWRSAEASRHPTALGDRVRLVRVSLLDRRQRPGTPAAADPAGAAWAGRPDLHPSTACAKRR